MTPPWDIEQTPPERPSAKGAGRILVDGREVACDARVRTWHEVPALAFHALGKRRETKAVVLHWTGGEGDSAQVHSTLGQRGLSVHFAIDRDGLITQYCDASALCSHAKGYNTGSVGVEIVNAATDKPGRYERALLKERVHGIDATRAAFLAPQTKAALALVRSLCSAYGLPLAVPMRGNDVLSSVMDQQEKADWRGVVGHLHVDRNKVDPGLALLRAVAAMHNQRWPDGEP